MSVKLGSARIDENGKAHGGKAGDQTGREVSTQSWYLNSKGWRVFRAKNPAVAEKIALCMERACKNNRIGYDQYQRNTLYKEAEKYGFDVARVTTPVETDCSALVRVCCAYAGILGLPSDFRTGNMPSNLNKTGAFTELKGAKYQEQSAYLGRGDILVTKNEGIVPQYYVQGDHEPIISKEMFLLVQEEISRRQAGKKDVSGRTSRYSTCHCFSHIVYCDKCGGLFRRVHWNNRGCKSIVWRCSNRLEKAEEKCTARTVREDDLESIVLRAINETFCQNEDFMSVLESNARMAVESKSGLSLKALEEKIASLQRKLVERVNHRENYEDLAEQIQKLQAEKAQRESDGAIKKRNAQALQDLLEFIRSQGNEIIEFDEKLVRRLVEKITISDETVTALFKSGQSIEING